MDTAPAPQAPTRALRVRAALVTLPLLVGLAASGCSGDDDGTMSAHRAAMTSTTSSPGTLDAPDADFLRSMRSLGREATGRGSMPMMSGTRGDRRLLARMVAQHRAMLAAARDERAHGTDPATRRLAAMMARHGRSQLRLMARMMRRR